MAYPRLTTKKISLMIGGLMLECFKQSSPIVFDIPYAGMAFYQPQAAQAADLTLELDTVEPDDSGKLLFGSDSFSTPTFLYQRDSGWYDWLTRHDSGTKPISFRISPDWSRFLLYQDETGTDGARAFWEFGHLFTYAVLNHNACVLHGVVMEYEGNGILVCAAAGTGKTTHTRMWRDHENALIINGDRCLCRKVDGAWYAYGMPWSGSSGEYINRRVRISAIVALERGEQNSAVPMNLFDSSLYLMQRCFIPHWTGDLQTTALDLTEDLAREVPVLKLFCRPDLESVQVLKSAIMEL